MRYNKTFSPVQIPDFLLGDLPRGAGDEFPLFVEFLEKYYEFIGQYTTDLEAVKNTSIIPEELLGFLRAEFAPMFPRARIDDRKLIEIVRHIYREKGNTGSFELLFRLFFEEAITITEPNKNILRASDGKWRQESSVLCDTAFIGMGFDVTSATKIKVSNGNQFFFISVSRVEKVSDQLTRFFFNKNINLTVVSTSKIDVIVDGLIVYRGTPKRQPNKIQIVEPGTNWKVGQVFRIEGSKSPSIAKIKQVGPNGEALSVELVQIGGEHLDGETIILSPFPNKPVISTINYTDEIIGLNPDNSYQYHYTLIIDDGIFGIGEELSAVQDIQYSASSYFLEDYVESGYVGQIEFYQKRTYVDSYDVSFNTNPELPLDTWLESRARFIYEFDYLTLYPGKFVSSDGMLSDSSMRLFDAYFYQLFSYVINSQNDLKKYSSVLDIVHPAGLKYFSSYRKDGYLDEIDLSVDRIVPSITMYFSEFLSAAEEPIKHFVKNILVELVNPADSSYWNFGKVLEDTPIATDANSKHITTGVSDSTTNEEYLELEINSTQEDIAISSDFGGLIITQEYDMDYFGETYIDPNTTVTFGDISGEFIHINNILWTPQEI